jgi:hypothetical protein
MERITAPDLDQVLGFGFYLDQASVIENERIAVLQIARLCEVKQESETSIARHGSAAAAAIIVIQGHLIGRFARPQAFPLE